MSCCSFCWQSEGCHLDRKQSLISNKNRIWTTHVFKMSLLRLLVLQALYVVKLARNMSRYQDTLVNHFCTQLPQLQVLIIFNLKSFIFWHITQCPVLLPVAFLFWSLFNPEDEGEMILPHIGWLSPEYKDLYPTRQNSPKLSLWEPQILNTLFVQYNIKDSHHFHTCNCENPKRHIEFVGIFMIYLLRNCRYPVFRISPHYRIYRWFDPYSYWT